ncbi:hypothetical protein ASH04_12180 [Rhodococcus sp. Leaf233]|nr:hypothetical protein ASH04_12180 [Rhodococcus sp. Leaf233]
MENNGLVREFAIKEGTARALVTKRIRPIPSTDQPPVTLTINRSRPVPAAEGVQNFGLSRAVRQRYFPAIQTTDQVGMGIMNSRHDHTSTQVDDLVCLGDFLRQ